MRAQAILVNLGLFALLASGLLAPLLAATPAAPGQAPGENRAQSAGLPSIPHVASSAGTAATEDAGNSSSRPVLLEASGIASDAVVFAVALTGETTGQFRLMSGKAARLALPYLEASPPATASSEYASWDSLIEQDEDPQTKVSNRQGPWAIVAISQNTIALLGLAPQPGVNALPPNPASALTAPMTPLAARVELAASVLPDTPPGWLQQAAWTVALAAFGILALRGVGAGILLFSRFDRKDVLEHDRRARLFEAIRADPGVAFGRLCERTGLAPGVAQHHLRLLEQHEVVRRVRDGRSTHYYPKGPKFTLPVALSAPRSRILEMLRAEPGLCAAELARRIGQRAQSTWRHLKRLEGAGLLVRRPQGQAIAWTVA